MTNAATTYAIVHSTSGMLIGLGATERAAWADAGREAKAAGIELDREEHECREAGAGKAWRSSSTGGITVAEEYDPAAAAFARLGGKAKSEAKAAAVRANGAKGGRPSNALRAAMELVRRDLKAAPAGAYGLGWLSAEARAALGALHREVRHQSSDGGALLGCYVVVGDGSPEGAGARPVNV